MAALLGSSMALSIFETDAPGHLDLEALRKGAFTEAIDPDGIRSGWVGLGNLLDTDNFILAANDSRFSGFSWRMDVRKPSNAVVKLQLAEKIREEETEGRKVSGKRKKELRDEIVQRLTANADFAPSVIDCLWDAEKGILMVGSTSEKIIDRILKHFQACFNRVPAQLATDEDVNRIFANIHQNEGRRLSAYTLQPLGTASLKTPVGANEETSSINARNEPATVSEALNKGMLINKISLMATDNNNEENQIFLSLDDRLQVNKIAFPKAEKDNDEDATFLINASICADAAQIINDLCQPAQDS